MPNSGGLAARAHVRATQDAAAVAKLRKAGFIVLCVTNVSELCMWYESSNTVSAACSVLAVTKTETRSRYRLFVRSTGAPATRMALHTLLEAAPVEKRHLLVQEVPHAALGLTLEVRVKERNSTTTKLTPTRAAICRLHPNARLLQWHLGSQTKLTLGMQHGGHVTHSRINTHNDSHCATQVDNSGQFPISKAGSVPFLCTGPLCRRAEDLWPLLQLLRTPGGLRPGPSKPTECGKQTVAATPQDVVLADVTVLVCTTMPSPPIVTRASKDVLDSVAQAAAMLRKAGVARVKEFAMPEFHRSVDMWSSLMATAGEGIMLWTGKVVVSPLGCGR